jgi:phosphoglycolate phosphatase-like HAD superfamily hydrolase
MTNKGQGARMVNRTFVEQCARRVCQVHLLVAALALLVSVPAFAQVDPLGSWNDGRSKQAIVQFVADVTTTGSPDFVEPAARIAVFDNDGTLWAEQPLYFQFLFMLDQLKAAAPKHPEWKNNAAFQALAAHDQKALAALGEKPLLELLLQANSGMSTAEYDQSIRTWLATARHPKFNRPYTDLVYLPMQELLRYLRDHGFKTFIVSGGSIEFMRPWAEKAYGIAPEQVVGTVTGTRFELRGAQPVLIRLPRLEFLDDGPGKPVGIYRAIGQQPIFAFGNSDGDWQMLQWVAGGTGPRFLGLVHHTDAEREFAYDRNSRVGKLDRALDDANQKGWTVVDMKNDWNRVFAFQ